jgi:hypothetical protein
MDSVKHYRAVILILASNNNAVFKNCRKVWKKYMNSDPAFRCFFVYGELAEPLDYYDPAYDLVFQDVKDFYPVFIEKTLRAFQAIESMPLTYDFFVRTNLSTFWDFENLHKHLDVLPMEACYSGDGPLHNSGVTYLSGTDTIVTPEMIRAIVKDQHLVIKNWIEDGAMGNFFHGHLGVPLLPNRICFFEDIVSPENQKAAIEARIEDAIHAGKDHYRVKTAGPAREHIDLAIYCTLLKRIYNIEY